jgi:hypothetical protein
MVAMMDPEGLLEKFREMSGEKEPITAWLPARYSLTRGVLALTARRLLFLSHDAFAGLKVESWPHGDIREVGIEESFLRTRLRIALVAGESESLDVKKKEAETFLAALHARAEKESGVVPPEERAAAEPGRTARKEPERAGREEAEQVGREEPEQVGREEPEPRAEGRQPTEPEEPTTAEEPEEAGAPAMEPKAGGYMAVPEAVEGEYAEIIEEYPEESVDTDERAPEAAVPGAGGRISETDRAAERKKQIEKDLEAMNKELSSAFTYHMGLGCLACLVGIGAGIFIGGFLSGAGLIGGIVGAALLGFAGFVLFGFTVEWGNAWYFRKTIRPRIDDLMTKNELTPAQVISLSGKILKKSAPLLGQLIKELKR